jgi:predicted nucleic acid-binding Zn ribbon protein
MLEAKVDGELIQAGPDSPEVAQCPACGGEVRKRRRKVGRDGHTYFYYMEKRKVSSWASSGRRGALG